MGRILQFFDFNQAIPSRKLLGHKRQNDGLEAPRNSLEFPVETSQIYHAIPEEIPYSCQLKHQSAKVSFPSNNTPIKKLLDEEMTWKKNDRCNRPSVVARLMGMDALPFEARPMISANEGKVEKLIPRKEPVGTISTHKTSLISTPSKQTKKELLPCAIEQDFGQPTKSNRPTKPQPREHPQEELLQKFKKDFEAWQASKLWERSRSLISEKDLIHEKDMQIIAQENLNKEKMARYMDATRDSSRKKSIDPRDHLFTARHKNDAEQQGGSRHERFMDRRNQYILHSDTTLRRASEASFAEFPVAKFNNEMDRTSSPTRIVLLKPSSERRIDFEDSSIGSPEMLQKENSMEDFLEEVKNRLKLEIYGKAKRETTAKLFETGTSMSRRSADPKQIAQHIAKQVRESVAKDFRATLMRSESMRSYRSEAYSDGRNSPEFIHRDTRKLLAERLKNVLRNETDLEIPSVASRKPSASFSKEEMRPVYDFPKKCKKISFWEDEKALNESKTRSFRHEHENNVAFETEEVSPRNLVRSFSAPVSGTAFGKLLLEDQHIMTGAHIRRKQEASEHTSAKVDKNKKDGFNLKGRVSNLRQNFTLKGKLFGKKVQLVNQSAEFPFMRMSVTAPTVVVNSGNAQDNSTEVPPSPASASSSPTDEICQPSHPSPVSPLEALFIEDHSSLQVFGELSSNPELSKLSEQVQDVGLDEVIMEEESCKDENFEVEGHAKAYVKDILVATGLYTGQPFDVAFSRWDSLTKPIAKWVFEEVEDAYAKNEKVEGESILCDSDKDLSHKMLFDLINEALPAALATPRSRSRVKKWGLGPISVSNGKKLLSNLWQQIQTYSISPVGESHSLDSLVAWDMKMSPFSNMQHEDIDVIGGEVECVILEELIDEFVRDLCFQI